MALIKEALNSSDPLYRESLYPDEPGHSKKVKPFTFSLSLPVQRVVKQERFTIDDGMEIEDRVFYFEGNGLLSLYISSWDYQFIVNLYNGLLDIKEFKFDNEISLKLNRVFLVNERNITSNEVIFKTCSPVLIEDREGKPILPDNARTNSAFNEHFNAIHDRILKDIRGEGLKKDIKFEPLKIKKQVVKHTLKGFREKTGKPYMTLTCFEGCFRLIGEPADLQMLYQIGIGLRTGQGFGMVEVV